jgi:hypothetical protein
VCVLWGHCSESTKQECTRAICNLSALEGCEQAITQGGGASGLIMIALFQSDTAYTKGVCVSALLNLMTHPACREQLIKEDFVWVLVKLASSDNSDDGTRMVCARALCSLSFSAKGCAKLIDHKAIPAMYMLCRDGDVKTQRYVAIALVNLTANAAAHDQVCAHDWLSVCVCVRLSLVSSCAWCGVVWCGVVWCGVVWCGRIGFPLTHRIVLLPVPDNEAGRCCGSR